MAGRNKVLVWVVTSDGRRRPRKVFECVVRSHLPIEQRCWCKLKAIAVTVVFFGQILIVSSQRPVLVFRSVDYQSTVFSSAPH